MGTQQVTVGGEQKRRRACPNLPRGPLETAALHTAEARGHSSPGAAEPMRPPPLRLSTNARLSLPAWEAALLSCHEGPRYCALPGGVSAFAVVGTDPL